MFQLHQLELEHQARRQSLVRVAVRARSEKRKAAREARRLRLRLRLRLHLASEAVGDPDGQSLEDRMPVRAAR